MKGHTGMVVGAAAGFVAALGLQSAFGGSAAPPQIAKAAAPTASDEIVLSERLAERAQLATMLVAERAVSPTLELLGSVDFDANRVADVGSRIEGRITRILVGVGDVVKQGQPLVEIESNELGNAIANLLSARANLIAAEHQAKRESELGKKQLSSAPVVEKARATAQALAAEVRGAEQRLLAMGLTPRELRRVGTRNGPLRITLRAPIAGEVVKRYAVLGQVVGPTQPTLRIADLSRLWVELDVYERDLAQVAEGDAAEIRSETYPDRPFRGVVSHVDATVDLSTRTGQVRIEVDNPERLLRPGQFVRARLSTRGDGRVAMMVPRAAVLSVEGQPSVFVVEGERRYRARPVELGPTVGDLVEVTRGLVEGDVLVTQGAFVLKSELLR